MKKFDLEAAKNGAAVCLRNGTPVKILDFQYRFADGEMILFKYHDIVYNEDIVRCADHTGRCCPVHEDCQEFNLFMAPVYAFACIYRDPMTGVLSTNYIHQTYEEAKANQLMDCEDREFFCHARIEMFYDEGKEGG